MHVREVMTESPWVCGPTATAQEAARVMWERDCGAVPVVDESGCAIGIVTDRDICMAAYFSDRPLWAIGVGEVMSRDLCTIDAEAELASAERRMQERQVRRLPVVAQDGSLVGILSLGDVAQAVSADGQSRQSARESQELIRTVTKVSEPRNQVAV